MNDKVKSVGVVVQGPWHENLSEQIIEYFKLRDITIVYSGWEEDRLKIKNYRNSENLILSKFIKAKGLNNRNLQRFSVARGVEWLMSRRVSYILKWRSDILPIDINFGKFIERSEYHPENNVGSRLVFSAFRSLPVRPDYLSTIPDLYMFGKSDLMSLMWHDENFDYSTNFCTRVLNEREDVNHIAENFLEYMFNPHAELYYTFKKRFNEKYGVNYDSTKFFSKVFFLEEDYSHKWIWFDKDLRVRRFKMSEFPRSLPKTTTPSSRIVPYDIKIWYKTSWIENLYIKLSYRWFYLKHIFYLLRLRCWINDCKIL